MAKSRRSYKGGAVANVLAGSALLVGGDTITVASDISGSWPTGSDPFFVVIDPGTVKEEKVCVQYYTTTSLKVVDPALTSGWVATSAGRGCDDTTARQHEPGAVIYPVFTALEANQANELVSKYTTNGDLVVHGSSGVKTFPTGGSGNNNKVLVADSTVTDGGVKWASITADNIAAGAVTSTKILDNTIVLGDLAAALQAFLVPVGTIVAYPGASAPTGWLLCNGTSTTGYTTLAALVGATTPDLQGYTLVGKGSAPFAGALLSKFGSTTSTAQHTHNVYHDHGSQGTAGESNGHTHDVSFSSTPSGDLTNVAPSAGTGIIAQGSNTSSTASSGISTGHTHTVDILPNEVVSYGSSVETAYGNVQPSALVNYIIKHD